MTVTPQSRYFLLSLRAKIEAPVRSRIQVTKGFRRTFLRVFPRHPSEVDLQSLDILIATILGMVFHPFHSSHVCPRHVQVTVSRSRGVRWLLRGASESNSCASSRSRLRRDREGPARPRGVHVVMTRAVGSTPTYHV